jgi:Cytochrome C oxidase, cbb3-type, subunit III
LIFAANAYTAVGWVLFAIVGLGVVIYTLVNVLSWGKAEVGSEIELAPNRKPYLSDEELEGPKLDKTLFWGLAMLVVIAIAFPLYWILEPGRMENATLTGYVGNETFVERGRDMFAPTGDNLQALNCAFCHGGMDAVGNVVEFNRTLPDGSIEVVNWKAPALNTVLLRYSREEVTYVLTYGRPFSPMPAWGLDGGGPLNEQQIQNLVDYLETIQLSPEEAQAQAEDGIRQQLGLPDGAAIDYDDPRVGEAIFNLGLETNFAGGAYACARCHTNGWSFATSPDQLVLPGGGGALGPGLAAEELQFPTTPDPVTTGSERGVIYGQQGQGGSGMMPGFGLRPPEPALYWINKGEPREFPIEEVDGRTVNSGMMTPEMIEAVVRYERGL